MVVSTANYPLTTLLVMARNHRKVIDYYRLVLEELEPTDQERTEISERIAREEQALVMIGQLAGLSNRPQADTVDHAAPERAI
jgi:hypothetical protein